MWYHGAHGIGSEGHGTNAYCKLVHEGEHGQLGVSPVRKGVSPLC